MKDLERFKIDNGFVYLEWIYWIIIVFRVCDYDKEKRNKFEFWLLYKEIDLEDLRMDVCNDLWWNGNIRKKRKKNIKI